MTSSVRVAAAKRESQKERAAAGAKRAAKESPEKRAAAARKRASKETAAKRSNAAKARNQHETAAVRAHAAHMRGAKESSSSRSRNAHVESASKRAAAGHKHVVAAKHKTTAKKRDLPHYKPRKVTKPFHIHNMKKHHVWGKGAGKRVKKIHTIKAK